MMGNGSEGRRLGISLNHNISSPTNRNKKRYLEVLLKQQPWQKSEQDGFRKWDLGILGDFHGIEACRPFRRRVRNGPWTKLPLH